MTRLTRGSSLCEFCGCQEYAEIREEYYANLIDKKWKSLKEALENRLDPQTWAGACCLRFQAQSKKPELDWGKLPPKPSCWHFCL